MTPKRDLNFIKIKLNFTSRESKCVFRTLTEYAVLYTTRTETTEPAVFSSTISTAAVLKTPRPRISSVRAHAPSPARTRNTSSRVRSPHGRLETRAKCTLPVRGRPRFIAGRARALGSGTSVLWWQRLEVGSDESLTTTTTTEKKDKL